MSMPNVRHSIVRLKMSAIHNSIAFQFRFYVEQPFVVSKYASMLPDFEVAHVLLLLSRIECFPNTEML